MYVLTCQHEHAGGGDGAARLSAVSDDGEHAADHGHRLAEDQQRGYPPADSGMTRNGLKGDELYLRVQTRCHIEHCNLAYLCSGWIRSRTQRLNNKWGGKCQ